MARGDQIYVMREFLGVNGVYEHHGIDCGDGTVIHYRKTDEAVISRTSLSSFSGGKTIFVKQHSISYIPDVVIERAESRLGEKRYDLVSNNCEHFANWCKTGKNVSYQLENFGLGIGGVSAYASRPLIEEAATQGDPEKALGLLHHAMSNITAAQNTLQPQYDRVHKEIDTWHHVAQLALKRGREDLARAALERKVSYKKRAEDFKAQLEQLAIMQEALTHNSTVLDSRVTVLR